MYKHRWDFQSDDPYHDVNSQVTLFYHVLLYGWLQATQICKNIIYHPQIHELDLNLKAYRSHNSLRGRQYNSTPNNQTKRRRSSSNCRDTNQTTSGCGRRSASRKR
jgi:hypothetical protein